jgi:hypothetical protein
MTVRNTDLSTREWETLKRLQSRGPHPNLDPNSVEILKSLGLVEEKAGALVVNKVGNRLLAQGRRFG